MRAWRPTRQASQHLLKRVLVLSGSGLMRCLSDGETEESIKTFIQFNIRDSQDQRYLDLLRGCEFGLLAAIDQNPSSESSSSSRMVCLNKSRSISSHSEYFLSVEGSPFHFPDSTL